MLRKTFVFFFTLIIPVTIFGQVAPLIQDNWSTHTYPYNYLFPDYDGNQHNHGICNGKICSSCGPTAFSRILRYWEFPISGNGSNTYTDSYGCTYSADFASTTYEYDKMPESLTMDSPLEEVIAVSTLMYHIATAVNDYWVTGSDPETFVAALQNHFYYSSDANYVHRDNYSKQDWIDLYKTELNAGRPIIVVGGTPTSGHWFICDGYNSNDEFHFIMGWGGEGDDFYDIDDPNGYSLDVSAVIGIEPDFGGKKLELEEFPNHYLQAGSEQQISWESERVDKIKIEFSYNNGYNWTSIAENISADAKSYNWAVPDIDAEKCKIRITYTENKNVYDKTKNVFSIFSQKELHLENKFENALFEAGAKVKLSLSSQGVEKVNIFYSADGGVSWQSLINEISTNNPIYIEIPRLPTSQGKIKVVDNFDSALLTESECFFVEIYDYVKEHHAANEETLILLQFDGDYQNQSGLTDAGQAMGLCSIDSESILVSGSSVLIDNSNGGSCVRLETKDLPNLLDEWSIDLWVRVDDNSYQFTTYPTVAFIAGEGEYDVFKVGLIKDQQKFLLRTHSQNGTETSFWGVGNYETGEWNHISLSADKNNGKIVFSQHNSLGELVAKEEKSVSSTAYNLSISSNDLYIGGVPGGSNIQFNGAIDEFRIRTKKANYNHQITLNSPSGGLIYHSGDNIPISWNTEQVSLVNLYYSENNGQKWNKIAEGINASEEMYDWIAPDITTDEGLIRVCSSVDSTLYDQNSMKFSVFITSAEETSENHIIYVFPNPASDKLNVSIPPSEVSRFKRLLVTNSSGSFIVGKEIDNCQIELDLRSWSSGLYFLKLIGTNEILDERFIITK